MKKWIWRHFAFELPTDWEMLQFSREMSEGRCAFADRYRFRFELNWRVVPGPPDFDRMLSDYRALLESEQNLQNVRRECHGMWQGLSGSHGTACSSRFGRYFAENHCLVELVFLWPGSRDRTCEKAVLDSCGYAGKDRKGLQHWLAFGMDMRPPAPMECMQVNSAPASADMLFARPRSDDHIRFRRLGMVSCWLNKPLERWLRLQVHRQAHKLVHSRSMVHNHMLETLKGIYVPKFILKRKHRYRLSAWQCPEDGRIYLVEVIARAVADNTEYEPYRLLSCCDQLRRVA
jgi:hypothetical protein